MVKVLLFAYLRDGIGKEISIVHKEGLRVKDVVEELNFDEEKISIILINGKHQDMSSLLEDGDKLFLFPPVGGG